MRLFLKTDPLRNDFVYLTPQVNVEPARLMMTDTLSASPVDTLVMT
ncbi:MAG TPA: hypothetical protein VF658_09160 [Pyrinomonadaceae bacterium]